MNTEAETAIHIMLAEYHDVIGHNAIAPYTAPEDGEEISTNELPSFVGDRQLIQTIRGTLHSGNLPGIDRTVVDWPALARAYRERIA